MSEKKSLDELFAQSKEAGAELPEELLDAIAGGMTSDEWWSLPTDVQIKAQNLSAEFIKSGLTCDIDAIVAQLMANYNG